MSCLLTVRSTPILHIVFMVKVLVGPEEGPRSGLLKADGSFAALDSRLQTLNNASLFAGLEENNVETATALIMEFI